MRQNVPTHDTHSVSNLAAQWLEELRDKALIPPAEREELIITVTESVDLAETGYVESGLSILLSGVQRAQEHWNGNSWGRILVLCYQDALDRYRTCYSQPAPAFDS